MAKFVRLKPYNPRRGYVRQRHMEEGVRFDVDRGWYRVEDEAFAERLSKLRQDENDPESPDLFDVCTEDEARRMQEAESASRKRATVDDALHRQASEARPRRSMTSDGSREPRRPVQPVQPDASANWPDDMNGGDRGGMLDPDPEGRELNDDAGPVVASPVGRIPDAGEADATASESPAPKTRQRGKR